MSTWTDWIDIERAELKQGPLNDFGVYEIRAVNSKGQPIPISRLVGVDRLGCLYVGRSGFRHQKTRRTIANRIKEFLRGPHSGGTTYARAKTTLQQGQKFSSHRLQVRAIFLPDDKIELEESKALYGYFRRHAELPPCNSALPKKK